MNIYWIQKWIIGIIVMIVMVIISLLFYIFIPIKTEQTIFIPKGSITSIISHLTNRGYNLSFIDKYLLIMIGEPQSGWISIESKKINRIDFLYKLTKSEAKIEKITLIPGETRVIFFQNIAKQLKLDIVLLERYYNEFSKYKEAGIYPDTYHVSYGIKEKRLIKFLIKKADDKYKQISDKIYGEYNPTEWLRVLIIASIIQKEAGNKEEMPIVSSVIYNRLKKRMRLQMDGTLNYGKYSHIRVTRERIKTDKSHFNTYKYRGLPPIPIGSVSLDAITSAIKPASTDYLYFMKNSNGGHDFAKSFKEHRANIRKSKQ